MILKNTKYKNTKLKQNKNTKYACKTLNAPATVRTGALAFSSRS